MKGYRNTLLLAILVLLGPLSLSAQEYFRQNRVRYRTFDFNVVKTLADAVNPLRGMASECLSKQPTDCGFSNSRDSHNDHNHGLYSAIDAVETFWSLAPLRAFASTNSSMASVKPSSGLEE